MKAEAITTNKYLKINEIKNHLKNVEFVVMAAPAPEQFGNSPIHFSVFLNTSENLPKEIQEAILNKFLDEHKIGKPEKLLSKLMPVGFAISTQDTPMPMLLIKQQDIQSIEHVPMFVMDFLADSDDFNRAKKERLTGWSYSYN